MQRQLEDEVMHPGSSFPGGAGERRADNANFRALHSAPGGWGEVFSSLDIFLGSQVGVLEQGVGNPGPLRLGQGAADRVGGSQVKDSVRSAQ